MSRREKIFMAKTKPKHDPEREQRITMEIVVDA